MKIILNEKLYAEDIIENQKIDKKPSKTLHVLAKYYFKKNMDAEQVRDNLEMFMVKNYPNYVPARWQMKLDNIVKIEKKNEKPLHEIEYIDVTEKELETIKNINSSRLEKLAFVLLVYAKIFNLLNGNSSNWVNSSTKDIFIDSKINVNTKEQGLMMYKLNSMNLIDVSHKVDCESVKVKYVDNDSDVAIRITDFRCFVYEYMKWRGDNVVKCAVCGKVLERSENNKNKYCKECWKEKKAEWNRENFKKWYNKQKI